MEGRMHWKKFHRRLPLNSYDSSCGRTRDKQCILDWNCCSILWGMANLLLWFDALSSLLFNLLGIIYRFVCSLGIESSDWFLRALREISCIGDNFNYLRREWRLSSTNSSLCCVFLQSPIGLPIPKFNDLCLFIATLSSIFDVTWLSSSDWIEARFKRFHRDGTRLCKFERSPLEILNN